MKKQFSLIGGLLLALVVLMGCPSPTESGPALSSSKDITAFRLIASDNEVIPGDISAAIDGTVISLTLPRETDVTSLVPTFTTNGSSVSVSGTEQVSGTTANNFSNAITYVVTAEDDSTQEYTVNVTVEAADAWGMLINGGFSADFLNWETKCDQNSGAEADFSIVDGAAYIDITSSGTEKYHVELQQSELTFTQNKAYTLTFDVWGDSNRMANVQIQENNRDNNGDGDNYTMYDLQNFSITQTRTTHSYTFFMLKTTDEYGRLIFEFGTDNNNVYLDNITLTEGDISIPAQGTDMIDNGDISEGLRSWTIDSFSGAAGTLVDDNGVLHATVTTISSSITDVQVQQLAPGLRLENGKSYRVTFDAWASAARDIDFSVWENGNDMDSSGFAWNGYSYTTHSLTTTSNTFNVDFTMAITNLDGGICFFVGDTLGDVYIDNVSVIELP